MKWFEFNSAYMRSPHVASFPFTQHATIKTCYRKFSRINKQLAQAGLGWLDTHRVALNMSNHFVDDSNFKTDSYPHCATVEIGLTKMINKGMLIELKVQRSIH